MGVFKQNLGRMACAIIACVFAFGASHAAGVLSQHGQIQNVQNYSSNPFWSPNSPYSNQFPQAVYVTGPAVSTDDCQYIVASIIATQCSVLDNCRDRRVSDIRPAVMLQLSRLPGHNYATSCAGYIDTEFNNYVERYANIVTPTAFPTATQPVTQPAEFQMRNPYEKQDPDWLNDMRERKQELEDLQSQNGVGGEHIVATSFPTTINDVSLADRMANAAAGYEPFKDSKAYNSIKLQDERTALAEQQEKLRMLRDMIKTEAPESPKKTDRTDSEKSDTTQVSATVQESAITKPDELESLLPWYGILVVKAGSLDKYANADVPIISTEYMKQNKSTFYPDNSNVLWGMWGACTHGSHMAADNDVVNRAAHIVMKETDSFWKGNDYYVYDGEDVYWGTANIIGEVALAVLTFGLSAYFQGSAAAAQTANTAVAAVRGVQTARVTNDAAKVQKAITAARAATSGTSAAAKASRAEAAKALADAGITVNKGTRAAQYTIIAETLEAATGGIRSTKWTTALFKPWRLAKEGIKPTNLNALYGKGVSWTDRFKRATITAGATGGVTYFTNALLKSFGYSESSISNYADGVSFNSFGLLSADDIEGHENDISHGTWLSFEESGSTEDNGPLNEALAFAEDFQKNMDEINRKNPECNVDIYVVQPGISNAAKMGKREIYYVIMNPAQSLPVRTKK